MAGESELDRRSSFPLFVGLFLVLVIVVVGFGAWGAREVYYRAKELEKVGIIAHSWMFADPQIAVELGTPTMTTGTTDFIEEAKSIRTAHALYHVTGSKNGGDIEIWMRQYPGGAWTVTGAILTTGDKHTVRIGTPPGLVGVSRKQD